MAFIAPAWVQANPSYVLPELLVQFQQPSGAFKTLSGGAPQARLGEDDLHVYAKRVNIRTDIHGGQSAVNQLPSASFDVHQISTPTYLLQSRAEYNHHDTAAAARWGIALAEAQKLGNWQAHFQMARDLLLYGFNPQKGEGLLNRDGATVVNLPQDENGNTNVTMYSPNSMFTFLLAEINGIKRRTMSLGSGRKFTILGPQRVLGSLEYQSVVQLTSFQRSGAGSATVKTALEDIMRSNGDTLEWTYDDTLEGKGANGTDAVIITMPDLERPKQQSAFDTNAFGGLAPGQMGNNLQYCATAAPVEYPAPLPGGALDIVYEQRMTSGWVLRAEGLTIVSMPYSA